MDSLNTVVYMLIGSASFKTLQQLKEKNKIGFAFLIPIIVSLLITAQNFVMYKGGSETLESYLVSFMIMALFIAIPVFTYVVYAKIKR